jgi:hypothetical protein
MEVRPFWFQFSSLRYSVSLFQCLINTGNIRCSPSCNRSLVDKLIRYTYSSLKQESDFDVMEIRLKSKSLSRLKFSINKTEQPIERATFGREFTDFQFPLEEKQVLFLILFRYLNCLSSFEIKFWIIWIGVLSPSFCCCSLFL